MKNLASLSLGYIKASSMTMNYSEIDYSYFIYSTYEDNGYVNVYNLTTFTLDKKLKAHKTELSLIKLNYTNRMFATCSDKGTIIRIFNTLLYDKVYTFKRGVSECKIYSLSFCVNNPNYFFAYSANGTMHLFILVKGEDKSYISGVVSGIYSNIASSLKSDTFQDFIEYKRSDYLIKNDAFKVDGCIIEDGHEGIYSINYKGELIKMKISIKSNSEGIVIESKNTLSKIQLIGN